MKYEKVTHLIKTGKTKQALKVFTLFNKELDPLTRIEIDSLMSRFSCLATYSRTNRISYEEENRELAKINYALLQIIEDQNSKEEEKNSDFEHDLKAIEKLAKEYIVSKKIKNNASRLREKSQIVRKIAQILMKKPILLDQLKNSNNQGIISGIVYKMKVAPNVEDLILLKVLSLKVFGNYSKGQITNTLGELVYSGQLRIGDDELILEILNHLKTGADLPLLKNIERVETALEYFIGKS